MKANELRIFNIILYNGGFNIITGILPPYPNKSERFNGKYTIEINPPDTFNVPIDEIEPAPLTPEIVSKIKGFKVEREKEEYNPQFNLRTKTATYSNWDWIEESGGFEINITTNSNNDNVNIGTRYKASVKYVHELQNLYYALTGEELEIELI